MTDWAVSSINSCYFKLVQYYCAVSNISTNLMDSPVNLLYLPQCQSTNDEMAQLLLIRQDVPEGFAVLTDFQTNGRGQGNNTWQSAKGQNLMFSLLLFPRYLEARHGFWLSAAIALGVAEALEDYLPGTKVKWPNDIFFGNRKLGGILIENQVSGSRFERSIVGIGININQLDLLPSATSLALERGREFDRKLIFEAIRNQVFWNLQRLQTEGWEKVKQLYYRKLFKMGTPHDYFLPDGQTFRAVLKGISESGELILISALGERRFQFKEVSFFP